MSALIIANLLLIILYFWLKKGKKITEKNARHILFFQAGWAGLQLLTVCYLLLDWWESSSHFEWAWFLKNNPGQFGLTMLMLAWGFIHFIPPAFLLLNTILKNFQKNSSLITTLEGNFQSKE